MEQQYDALELLDLMREPAFCVRGGIIVKVNPAASAYLIETGSEAAALLLTGAEEYAAFSGGCLYLTLKVGGGPMGAAVTRVQDLDVFTLEDTESDARLQAMALAARELRTPLSNVMATCNQLPADAQTQELRSHINRGLYQILRILGNMSDAGTASGGRLEMRDICAVLDEIFQKAEILTAHTGIRLEYTGYPQQVYTLVDADKIERAVWNILSNAIKFTDAGETISAVLFRRGNSMYLSISDTGCGIADNLRGSIFSRYTRQPSIEDSRNGLGLGMVLIRKASAIHGGTVLVDQQEGRGTRITVSFAVRQGEAMLRSPRLRVDYTGERDHGLVELSGVLPARLYSPDENN